MAHHKLHFHPEVEAALANDRPVVALESTLITHGFPQPDNVKIAREIEAAVREQGAIPATIAILAGQIWVGLTDQQLEDLAARKAARKCSVRDLPVALAQKNYGGTTVAATMMLAHRAGIQVFATGGIGGIHRPEPLTHDETAQIQRAFGSEWDVSADLNELGRTPITVVCAGMKAFLALSATLEYLETQAVPVVGYGVDTLPAFYSRNSGLPLEIRADTPTEVAAIIEARNQLQLQNRVTV